MDFAVSVDHWVKLRENEKKDKYSDLARELKTMEHENDVYTNYTNTVYDVYPIYQPLRSGRIWHKVNF